ncbi:MAG: class I SAM-dependent methyltransferase [bacterium]|nr:class I SAM-dependent methyltransferase [bacterium]
MEIWHGIGRQLGHPTGLAGRIVGRMMRLANDRPTRVSVDALTPCATDILLDLGFGPGHAVALMAAKARHVDGIDRSVAMLRQASRRNRRAIADGRVALSIGRFDALPYPDDRFDGILASNVVYFWQDERAVLAEIRRVLKPGGRLCVYVTDAVTMAGWRFAGKATHRHFTPEDLTQMLLEAGFDRDAIETRPVRIANGVNGIVSVARS